MAYLIFPHCECFLFFSGISYLWHAFVDPKDPTNQYVNSVTILNGNDNIWNEDYHVVHHHSPNTHWTNSILHFEKHKDSYAKYNATIFQGIDEGNLLHLLFAQNWDAMAKHFVDLNGKMTHEEKKKLIITRLSYVVGEGGREKASERHFNSWGTSTIRDWDEDNTSTIY